jgi:hypothetical protein
LSLALGTLAIVPVLTLLLLLVLVLIVALFGSPLNLLLILLLLIGFLLLGAFGRLLFLVRRIRAVIVVLREGWPRAKRDTVARDPTSIAVKMSNVNRLLDGLFSDNQPQRWTRREISARILIGAPRPPHITPKTATSTAIAGS